MLLFARENVPLRVAVGCVASAEWYEFYVQDNGQGIRKAYLERIFDIFEQLVPNRRGTGMGLTLVRRIVEQHGGRVWAESEGEGRGTEIRFTLPRTDLPEDLMRKNFGPPRGTDDDLPNVL
jgi:signal transduction histidine kinase